MNSSREEKESLKSKLDTT